MKISKIILYDEPSVPEIDLEHQKKFLQDTFSVEVEIRKNIFNNSSDAINKRIASCRLFKLSRPFERHVPTAEEIEFEKANAIDSGTTENLVMYDGFELQQIVKEMIPPHEANLDTLHIIFTNKLTCTYDYNDYRYHGRAVICSNPSTVSTTGIIEAPAKPREYYMGLASKIVQGLNVDSIKKQFVGTYLEYHDKRLHTIVEGYLLQAVFYFLTGEGFCDELDCRLNNAHWQKDLLHSQIEIGKLCNKHEKILQKLVNNLN